MGGGVPCVAEEEEGPKKEGVNVGGTRHAWKEEPIGLAAAAASSLRIAATHADA